MFLIIDNYDSFVHNLARYFEIAGVETLIRRNDKIAIEDIESLKPKAIILSPGPCKPEDSGICLEIVEHFTDTPIFGVCLGHQCIAEYEGAKTVRAAQAVHGRASIITHDGKGLFKNIPSPMKVGRYHSLINDIAKTDLIITAKTEDGTPMALQHKTRPLYGVQFHPESILTEHGQSLIDNFVRIVQNQA